MILNYWTLLAKKASEPEPTHFRFNKVNNTTLNLSSALKTHFRVLSEHVLFSLLPVTIYAKGIGSVFDLLQFSKLEEMWFGAPVYSFDDNRLWVEANFTLGDLFTSMDE